MSHLTDFHPLEATTPGDSNTQSPMDPTTSLSPSSSTSTAELVSMSAPVNIPTSQNKPDHLSVCQHDELSASCCRPIVPVSDEFDNNTVFGSFAMTQSLRSNPDVALEAPRTVQRAISTSARMECARPSRGSDGDDQEQDTSPSIVVEDPFFPFLNPDLGGDMSDGGMSASLISDVNKVAAQDANSTFGHGTKKKRWMITKGLSEADIGPHHHHHRNSHHGDHVMTAAASTMEVQPAQRTGIPINNACKNHPPMARHLSRQSSKGLRRKSSITSNLSFVGNYVFGSSIFQSPTRSATSMASEKVNIVTDSLGIYPSMISLTSAEVGVLAFEDELVVPLSTSQARSSSAYSSRQNSRHDLQQDAAGRKGPLRSISNKGSSASLSSRLGEDKLSLRDDEEATDKLTEVKPIVSRIQPPKKQWQQTMPDLVEGPESDTLTVQSTVRKNLAAAALAMAKMEAKQTKITGEEDAEESDREGTGETKVVTPGMYKKNLFVLCVVFFFSFAAYMSLRNLQSSLNDSGGLGMYSLSCIYAFLFIGSLFTTTIIQRLRPKFSMLIGLVGILSYNACNFYPSHATLIPGSCIAGFSLAIMWTSQATYIANNAASYAIISGQRFQDCLSRFHGIFFASFQFSQMVGGAISSVIFSLHSPTGSKETVAESYFMNASAGAVGANSTYREVVDLTVSALLNQTSRLVESVQDSLENVLHSLNEANASSLLATGDATLYGPATNGTSGACGMSNCPGQKSSSLKITFEPEMYYVMVGVFVASVVISILILLFFLDPLEGSMKNPRAGIVNQLTSVFRMLVNPHVICLLPFMAYTLLQATFVFGEFNKAFVTCYLGIHMIGYLTVCLSVFSSFFAFVTGSIQKYVGPEVIVLSGLLAHLSVLISFWLWTPTVEQTYMFFIIVAVWGAGDGMLTTQIISLLGILFVNNKESAFSTYKMTQSSSAFLLFITGPYLCTRTKVCVLTVVAAMAIVGYLALKARLRLSDRKSTQLPKSIADITVTIAKDKS